MKTNPEETYVGRIFKRMEELVKRQKIFQRSFDTVVGEKLVNCFRCDVMFREDGPVKGVLYVSTAKLAFCSKKLRLPHNTSGKQYLKVLH